MGVCPTPARHVARPTLCVSGLCHRLPRAGLGATQTTTDPVRDRRMKFPYPHSLGTLVGVTSGASGPHARTPTLTQGGGGGGAAVQPACVTAIAPYSEGHGGRCGIVVGSHFFRCTRPPTKGSP